MRKLNAALSLLVLLTMARSTPGAAGPVDTHNLIRNGDFEARGRFPGWTPQARTQAIYAPTLDALTGRRALRIAVPTPGDGVVTSDPFPVSAGSDYLLTFWYRAEGMSTKGSTFDGCSAGMNVLWDDASGKQVGAHLCALPYGAVPDYRVATRRLTAAAGAARARVQMYASVRKAYKGPPTVVFIDQVRLTKIAEARVHADAQRWEYLHRRSGSGLQIVPDKDAVKGEAVLAAVGKANKNAGLTWGQYTSDQPIGDYLAIFRLKVKDNTKAEPAAGLHVSAFGALSSAIAQHQVIRATDFKQAGVYQEFAVRFIRPEDGILEFTVSFLGATDLWFDKTTVVQLASFTTDKEQAAIWLGEGAYAVGTSAPARQRKTILVLRGLGHQVYLPASAKWKPAQAVVKSAYVARRQTGFVLDAPFPKSLKGLKDVKVIVLADVPASALNGLMGRRTLRRFVEAGGGLCMFGGPLAYGKGALAGSALEDLLPVTTTGPWDLVKASSPAITLGVSSALTRNLAWDRKPVVHYYHKVVARAGKRVLLACEGNPLLVTGRPGDGKVALFMATCLGEPGKDETFLFRWSDYPALIGRTMRWLFAQKKR